MFLFVCILPRTAREEVARKTERGCEATRALKKDGPRAPVRVRLCGAATCDGWRMEEGGGGPDRVQVQVQAAGPRALRVDQEADSESNADRNI